MSCKLKLLIVEDDEGLREALQDILSPDFEVLTAQNGVEGLEVFAAHNPGLVLSDVKMPKLNGLEMMKKIKEQSSVPVVIMTGFSEEIEEKGVLAIGADGFVAKPFDPDELVMLLQNVILRTQKSAA